MHHLKVSPADRQFSSKDQAFRKYFSVPLAKKPPRLPRKGYIRALELYGSEDILLDRLQSSSVSHFNKWRKQNPGDLESYRCHANSLGYDWERGSVTKEGIYTSYVPVTATGGPPIYNPNSPPSPEHSSGLPRDISQLIHAEGPSETAGEESMTTDPNGRFAAINRQQANTANNSHALHNQTVEFQTPGSTLRSPIVIRDIPLVLQNAPGNLRFIPGEVPQNGLGAASIASVALTMLRAMKYNSEEITADDMADIEAVLDYFGEEDMEEFVKGFQTDLAPQGQRRFAIFSQNGTLN